MFMISLHLDNMYDHQLTTQLLQFMEHTFSEERPLYRHAYIHVYGDGVKQRQRQQLGIWGQGIESGFSAIGQQNLARNSLPVSLFAIEVQQWSFRIAVCKTGCINTGAVSLRPSIWILSQGMVQFWEVKPRISMFKGWEETGEAHELHHLQIASACCLLGVSKSQLKYSAKFKDFIFI